MRVYSNLCTIRLFRFNEEREDEIGSAIYRVAMTDTGINALLDDIAPIIFSMIGIDSILVLFILMFNPFHNYILISIFFSLIVL